MHRKAAYIIQQESIVNNTWVIIDTDEEALNNS